MQIDIDYYTTEGKALPQVVGAKADKEYPVIRMFGVSDKGNSIMVHVHKFLTYFYVEIINETMIEEEPII